ncbi:MAG: hypothetical protein LBK57_03595 [Clostridiales Family XIII bacterium]|jgi:hypothetical protein|nr:hypothetical protein [Clostridiales Family XIII bacterium]
MKIKRIVLLMCVVPVLLFSACNNYGKKPENTSDRMYELGILALETIDDYLDGKIEIEEADKLLEQIDSSATSQRESDLKTLDSETLVGTEYANDDLIESYIYFAQHAVSERIWISGTKKDIIESRNDLADRLNEKHIKGE